MHNLIHLGYYMAPDGRVYVEINCTYIEVSPKLWWLPTSIRPATFNTNIV